VSPGVLGELVTALDQVFHFFVGQLSVDEVFVLLRERVGIEQACMVETIDVRQGLPLGSRVGVPCSSWQARTLGFGRAACCDSTRIEAAARVRIAARL
jgi:hypothetical protein